MAFIWRMHITKSGIMYAYTGSSKIIYMHILLFGKFRDHIDGDGLNNQEMNIRKATAAQNGCNQRLHKNNTSGVPGVTWHKHQEKWVVNVQAYDIRHCGGYFENLDEAKIARNELAKKLHGEFARIY